MVPRLLPLLASPLARRSLVVAGLGLLGFLPQGLQAPSVPRDLLVEVHCLEQVREPRPFFAQVTLTHPGEVDGPIQIQRVRIESNGEELWSEPVGRSLSGDPEYARIQGLIERLPEELAHKHGAGDHDHGSEERVYSRPGEAELDMREGLEVVRTLPARIAALTTSIDAGAPASFTQVTFLLPADQVLATESAPGTEAPYSLLVDYALSDGTQSTRRIERTLERLPSFRVPPTLGNPIAGGATLWSGDLHVHSCHGEAAGACAPSDNCTAESFQLSGSFSFAELKTQFQALGINWFTATDHSYCVDTDGEYAAVVAECAAITDGSFLALPDMELSSEEEGGQTGSDTGDLLCLLGPSANHMGAHGIQDRIYGGDSGLLGFCNGLFSDALNGFRSNLDEVHAQGGWAIANHPDGGSFGWNSRDLTVGQEAGGVDGVEIWNGGFTSGQGGNVGAWVNWLLAGRRMFAFSGSDTHDEANAFGANHVLFEGTPTPGQLQQALRSGRSYISNGPALVLEAQLGGVTLPMGTIQPMPYSASPATLPVRALFDVGGATGTVTIFRGAAGDAAETVFVSNIGQTGSGEVQGLLQLTGAPREWVRAYFESDDGALVAYTNPIFFEAGEQGATQGYCVSRPDPVGCDVGLSWQGTPSATAGSGFTISASGIRNQTFGIPVWSLSPNQQPFFGGTLCVANPLVRGAVQATGGSSGLPECSGQLSLDVNALIASGVDPTLVLGTTAHVQFWYRNIQASPTVGLTDAVQFTVGP